jgi:leucyl/phenylalanyl-tRNA--protein transferase
MYYPLVVPFIIRSNRSPVFPENLEPDEFGLVALGGTLSVETLIEAYSKGIFPWSGRDPIPWFSPDPRLVLVPDRFHVSKSLKKEIGKKKYAVKTDTNFLGVVKGCAGIQRPGQRGTWIDKNIMAAYYELFKLSIAHSVEVYDEGILCGGLYGVSLGKCFFGESMFATVSNASKIALFFLTRILVDLGFLLIDCQQVTPHLLRMGATPIPRKVFLELLSHSRVDSPEHHPWQCSL